MRHGVERGTLRVEAIQKLVDAAAARARELDIRVHIAVMDSSAELVGWLSFDGTPRIAATTARHKAFTAVQTGMATVDWKAYVESIPAEERQIIDGIEGYIAALQPNLLAIMEIPGIQALNEIRYSAPVLERMLKRKGRDDQFDLRRRTLAKRVLARL